MAIVVTMFAEAILDQVWWSIVPRVGSLCERVLVAMDVLVGVPVGVACCG